MTGCTRANMIRLRWQNVIQLALLGGAAWAVLAGAALAAPSSEKIPVVASIIPLGDFCRHLGGDRVAVEVIIPPGASPHLFEPPPSVVVRAHKARVLVYIGAGLEPWMEKLLRSRGDNNLIVVEAARGIPLLQKSSEHDQGPGATPGKPPAPTEAGDHRARSGNPHIWLDPVLAQDICRRLSAALIQADPGHRPVYKANLAGYLKDLEILHQEIQGRVASWRIHDYVGFHPAFTYLAHRYGLREVGVMEAAPGREPTPRHLQKIIAAIRRTGIRVVFAEPQFNPRVAQVVAREAGVQVLMLDPMGGRPPYGSDYLKMMRHNLAIMDKAMK